jgi:hypothetical protein
MKDEKWNGLFGHYSKRTLKRFKEFHQENPHIFKEFKQLAYKMKKAGRKKYSAQAIIYVIRFNQDLKTTGDVFKINNDFTSIYARLLMYRDLSMENFFEIRKENNNGIKSMEHSIREIENKA